MASFDFATLRSGRTVVGYFAEASPTVRGCGILRGRPLPPFVLSVVERQRNEVEGRHSL